MGTGIKQVKDGCWTFGDGDKVCYPYPADTGGGGASGEGFSEYEVLVDETITSEEEITEISYTDLDFSKYNDIVIYFDKPANANNTPGNRKIKVEMLGYTVVNIDLGGVDAYRSALIRVLNMGNNNVASFASVANNQSHNPSNLTCNGIYPLNGYYIANYDKGFKLIFNTGYMGTCKLKIMAR